MVGYAADVELVGSPTKPPDGEQVLAVEAVSLMRRLDV